MLDYRNDPGERVKDCDAVLAIADAWVEDDFVKVLKEAMAQGKQVFTAGSQIIPPDLFKLVIIPQDTFRIMEALQKLADALCLLREVTK